MFKKLFKWFFTELALAIVKEQYRREEMLAWMTKHKEKYIRARAIAALSGQLEDTKFNDINYLKENIK